MREVVNFRKLLEDGLKRYHDPVHGDSLKTASEDSFIELCNSLLYEIEANDGVAEATQFVANPETYSEALRSEDYMRHSAPGQDSMHGQPIATHHTMPKEKVLCYAPDALTFGGTVVHPWMIAIGTLKE